MDEKGDVKLTWRDMSATEGLQLYLELMGQPKDARRGRILVHTGTIRCKWYSFRRRMGDGHILTRWGRVVSARATYGDNKLLTVSFRLQNPFEKDYCGESQKGI
jgi:hypothetical protein